MEAERWTAGEWVTESGCEGAALAVLRSVRRVFPVTEGEHCQMFVNKAGLRQVKFFRKTYFWQNKNFAAGGEIGWQHG